MRFEAVLLDLGDTVFGLDPIDLDAVAGGFAAAVAERVGLEAGAAQMEARRVLDGLREDWRQSYARGAVAEPGVAAVAAPHLQGFGAAANSLAYQLDELFGAADVARFRPAADCASRVQQIRDAGLKVGIVSNTTTSPRVLTRYLESVGVAQHAGAIAYSVEVGVRKPHESIYRGVLDQLRVPAERAVFVGDRVREDVLGPQALGMQAVLTHEFRQEPAGGSEPLAVIRALSDLLDLLG